MQTATQLDHDPRATTARDTLCRAAVEATLAALGDEASDWLANELSRGASFVVRVELPSGGITAELIRDGDSVPLFRVYNLPGGNA